MKQKNLNKKSRLFRAFIFLIKIPLILFRAWVDAKSTKKEPDIIEDLYMQNPNLFDPRPLRDRPPNERY